MARQPCLRATSLIEVVAALAVAGLTLGLSLPPLARLLAPLAREADAAQALLELAPTLERLRARLEDARAVLAPRAPRGARRAPLLLALDELDRPFGVAVEDGRLALRLLEPATGAVGREDLGPCDRALFHDRGRTRNVLRIRLALRGAVLMTSLRLTNRPEPPELGGPAEGAE